MIHLTNMNINNIATIEESLTQFANSFVVAKLSNGRVISGFLKETDGNYTIKLGVLHISITASNLAKPVIAHP
jgi:hypothetical protein